MLFRQRTVFCYFLRAPLTLFHLHSLKCTTQLMVCIGRSELIHRYCNKTPCTLFECSCRWSWRSPFLGHLAPCSVRHYQPLIFILLQGAQRIEKIRERPLLTTIQIHSQTNPPRLCILLPQCIPMGNAIIHEFQKSFQVRSSARSKLPGDPSFLHSVSRFSSSHS
jgi:hypothetical protein